jgi:phosphoglycolate phosphatase-like HAD superfamily hydrolase
VFKLCLFDLDETLVRTDDLEEVRLACKNNAERKTVAAVKQALPHRRDRHIYDGELLEKIREKHPEMKLGVFTRSPRSYAEAVLDWAYPGFEWDILVAYEDVRARKPHGDGIDLAMKKFGIDEFEEVVLVGDNDIDIRAAYNCGCVAVLDKSAWPYRNRTEHWRALSLVPDAIIDSPSDVLRVLKKPYKFAPELERLLAGEKEVVGMVRFDRLSHFVPKEFGGGNKPFYVYVCGRSFTTHESVKYRHDWHALTNSIRDSKNAEQLPKEWVEAIRNFITDQYITLFDPIDLVVTVVPHRPERKARLEGLLKQLKDSIAKRPLEDINLSVAPDLLAYKDGVKSQHNDHLNQLQRFENVRDHLIVKEPQLVAGAPALLVLDDVVTSGASLFYAMKYLKERGAAEVKCLAMGQAIGNVLP